MHALEAVFLRLLFNLHMLVLDLLLQRFEDIQGELQIIPDASNDQMIELRSFECFTYCRPEAIEYHHDLRSAVIQLVFDLAIGVEGIEHYHHRS